MTFFLLIFSLLNRAGCRIKNFLYSKKILAPQIAPLPVVSVGSLSLGGSEKTPLALALISQFQESGYRPAFISRGYKGRWERRGGILSDGKKLSGSWEEAGDEPYMVFRRMPQVGIFIGKDRFASCRKAKAAGFDLAVLDDGFQHLRLHRDLDMVIVDWQEKIRLRESLSGLNRADIILVKRGENTQQHRELRRRFPRSRVSEYTVRSVGLFTPEGKTSIPYAHFQGKRVFAFCGIAKPARFLALLKKNGVVPAGFHAFPDHCRYTLSEMKKIRRECLKTGADTAVTTEKDVFKTAGSPLFQQVPLYYLKIELRLEKELFQSVKKNIGI